MHQVGLTTAKMQIQKRLMGNSNCRSLERRLHGVCWPKISKEQTLPNFTLKDHVSPGSDTRSFAREYSWGAERCILGVFCQLGALTCTDDGVLCEGWTPFCHHWTKKNFLLSKNVDSWKPRQNLCAVRLETQSCQLFCWEKGPVYTISQESCRKIV